MGKKWGKSESNCLIVLTPILRFYTVLITHMPETANVSRMAELLASELFSIFKWTQHGPMNENNSCICSDFHKLRTHPADVVFSYKDPYSAKRIYLLTDLKSYSVGSISYSSVKDALISLVKAVECAQIDQEWKRRYTALEAETVEIQGLLFIYNHDSLSNHDFKSLLDGVRNDLPKISKSVKISILSPDDINYLNNISHDMLTLSGKRIIPSLENCYFFYPDADFKRKVVLEKKSGATLQSLKEPWQILRYSLEDDKMPSTIVYYKGSGERPQEFLYLIDMLSFYQLLTNSQKIQIRSLPASPNAITNFQRALDEYKNSLIDRFSSYTSNHEELIEKFDKISFSTMPNVLKVFSTTEIGTTIR